MSKKIRNNEGEPLSFRKLKKIEYKVYSKGGKSTFYNTTDYELVRSYKPISNI